jgi:myosin heavy subunit
MADTQYWVPHPTEVFLVGTKKSATAYDTCVGEVNVSEKQTIEEITDKEVLKGVSDCCSLAQITEASILHTTKTRFARGEIYTNVSTVLLALNPFEAQQIYSSEYIDLYKKAKDPLSHPPHVFQIGAHAFAGLSENARSQAICISGESGAGKTETTKLMLLYASDVLASGDGEGGGLEDMIVQMNPILEAFGNAKTVRNNNSSRFGKWIEIQVDTAQRQLVGANITQYLLEVTRVIGQGPGERNYHIFHQLINDEGMRQHLQLEGMDKSPYLCANPVAIAEIDDKEELAQLRSAFVTLNYGDEEVQDVFRMVAGILHIGALDFDAGSSDAKISTTDTLAKAAELLRVEAGELSKCVCFRKIKVAGDTVDTPLDVDKARQARDSIAKLIYSRLFKWLVARCNQSLGEHLTGEDDKASKSFLGVLDIAGFESFEKNQLEQLLINLSNEKIHQFFISLVFKTELSEYAAEGVPITNITFDDNADVLALIEAKDGLLAILDDCTTGVKQTDATFTTKAVTDKKANKRFIAPKFAKDLSFGINHYAGSVVYTTVGFLEKNFSSEPAEVLELLSSSKAGVMRELVVEQVDEVPKKGAKKPTVGGLYRKSLAQLIEKLSTAHCHFVRCIKPNKEKVPRTFTPDMVSAQLRIGGVMETVAIRKAGFLVRDRFDDFLSRYFILVGKAERPAVVAALKAKDQAELRKIAEKTITAFAPPAAELALGKTKVFIKASFYKELEQRRRDAYDRLVPKIQAAARGYTVRVRMADVKEIDRALRKFMLDAGHAVGAGEFSSKKIDRATIHADFLTQFDLCLMRALNLPLILPFMKEANNVRAHVSAAAELSRKLQEMQGSVDVTDMQAAIAQAENYKIEGAVVDAIVGRVEKVKQQMAARRSLQDAVENSVGTESLKQIEESLEDATKLGLDKPDAWLLQPGGPEAFEAAMKTADQLREELRRIAELRAARLKAVEDLGSSTDVDEIQKVLAEAAESGLGSEPAVESLGTRLVALEIQLPLLKSLKQCEDLNDIEAVEGIVGKVQGAGLETQGDWVLEEGFVVFEAAKTKLAALKAQKAERENERNEINSRIADLTESSRDVAAMESLMELTKRSSIAEFDIKALEARCAKVKAQTDLQLSLRNCEAQSDVAEVKRVVDAVVAAGLDKPEGWLLPDGHGLFERAKAREESLGKIAAAKARITDAAAKFDYAEIQAAMNAISELGVQQSEYSEAHEVFLKLNSGTEVRKMLDEGKNLSEAAQSNLKQRLTELKPAGVALLEKLTESCDLLEIQSALAQAEQDKLSDGGAKELVQKMKTRCDLLQKQQSLQKQLDSCAASDDVSEIAKLVGEADSLSLGDASNWLVPGGEKAYAVAKSRAEVLRNRQAEDDNETTALRDAAAELMKSTDVSAMKILLGKSASKGLGSEPAFEELRARSNELEKQTSIMNLLRNCAVMDDMETVQMALTRAKDAGLDVDSKWLNPAGPATRATAAARLEELQATNTDKPASKLEIEMKALKTSLDVSAMQSLLARADAVGVKKEVSVQLKKRCEAIQAQMPLLRSLKNCLHFDDIEAVEAVLKSVRDAGLNDAEKWILPEGPKQYTKACALPEYLRKVKEWQANVDTASRVFDVKELRRAFHVAEDLGLPDHSSRPINKLYVELQSSDNVEKKLKSLREIKDPSQDDMLAMTNLVAQLKVLGVNVDNTDLQKFSLNLAGGSRKSVLGSGSTTTRALAIQVYDDLSNFSELRDPATWGTRGLRKVMRAQPGGMSSEARLRGMLTYTTDKISEPLTKLGDEMELEQAALKNFWNLLRCMGDRPSVFSADRDGPVIKSAASGSMKLRDEAYVQLMKQLTNNPSVNSSTHGWKLMKKLVEQYMPSPELCQFLHVFLEKATKEEVLTSGSTLSATGATPSGTGADAQPEAKADVPSAERNRSSTVQFSEDTEDKEQSKLGRPSLGAGRRKSTRRKSVMAEAEQIVPSVNEERRSFEKWKNVVATEVLEIFNASLNAH